MTEIENLQSIFRRQTGVNKSSTQDQEMDRILSLPVIGKLTPEELEAFNQNELRPQAYQEGSRLFPVQAEGVLAYDQLNGLFGPIGVGGGKSLLSLMIASRAFWRGVERIVLFNPPQLLEQLRVQSLPFAKTKVQINCPFQFLDGKDPSARKAIAKRRAPACYVMPYSLLSRPDTEDFLEQLGPDLLIFDEAHYIKDRKSARTRRVMKYIALNEPQMVVLSGTMTQKTLLDYHHMIKASLKQGCPLPIPAHVVESWACVLDAGSEEISLDNMTSAKSATLRPVVLWAKRKGLDVPDNLIGFRRAFKFRLNTAPGVVSSPDDEIGVSLTILNKPVPDYEAHPSWPELKRLMTQVDQDKVSPSGDEIAWAFHKWKYLDELTAGFYHLLEWPDPAEYADRRGLTVENAAEIIQDAMTHHEVLQEYHKKLRRFLSDHHVRHLDTPLLVGRHLALNGPKGIPYSGHELFEAWSRAKDLEFPGMPERVSRPVRVSDYKIKHAVSWAEEQNTGVLVWYYHKEIGRWLKEAFQEAGLDAVHCPAGKVSNQILANTEGLAGKAVILSLAHREGKNLQHHFDSQFYVQFPRQADRIQQAIGRTHRSGQLSDEVFITKCDTTEFDELNFSACLVDAAYQHGTGGNRQKVIYANYIPIPKIHPPEFLLERDLKVRLLDEQERRILTEKFNP